MHPPLLEDFGLVSGLHAFVEGFSRRTGVEVVLNIAPDIGRLPREVELAIFRILQEGLTNIARHSGTHLATLSLERRSGQLLVELEDRGRGFSGGAAGIGLTGMQERAELLGGRFQMTSGRQGAKLSVTLPLFGPEDEDADTDCG
jgi:signal transduction histidine kinase